ncbi:MAG: hypothetical protein NUV67_04915 [archaeon]|nr:hypothetical protein [archaeon]
MQTFSQLGSEEQQEFYAQILDLKKEGFGYKRIIKKFAKEKQVKLSPGILSYWFNNGVKNIGGENCFIPKASPELSFVLGVMFGDGSLSYNKKRREYSLSLKATDKDFVEKFAGCGAKVVDKNFGFAAIKLKARKNDKPIYTTKIHGKKLYTFVKEIKKDFGRGEEFIGQFPAEFIQGLADSEGTCSVSPCPGFSLVVNIACSTNYPLLEYVKIILSNNYGVECGLQKTKSAGQQDSVIDGRVITRTKDLFVLSPLGLVESLKFLNVVGFSIARKVQKFDDYIFLREKYGRKKASALWLKIYHKEGRFWIRNDVKPIKEYFFDN